MPFIRYPGLEGKIYVPDGATADPKKHPCRDCYACQMCSDGRCRSCLGQRRDRQEPRGVCAKGR